MFLGEIKETTRHERLSKHGKRHVYYRKKSIVKLRCDNCEEEFTRERGSMNPKRLNNNYFHVCGSCDSKVFAQKKGIERKQIWDMPASMDIPISKL
jgi:NAD-dependent SIR2 family protein deacetylase